MNNEIFQNIFFQPIQIFMSSSNNFINNFVNESHETSGNEQHCIRLRS